MTDKNDNKAIPYSVLIPSPENFSGDKFKKVLKSHGLTVLSGENGTKTIRLDAHGEYPDIFIEIPPFAENSFDKYVFSEVPPNFPATAIPYYSIERRLQYLNSILLKSGYVGEKITLNMLNSTEPLNLAPGFIAMNELELFKNNAITGIHSAEFYFNNPKGEEERQKVLEQRSIQSMQAAEEALREFNGITKKTIIISAPVKQDKQEQPQTSIRRTVRDTLRLTAVIDGRTINLSLNAAEQQKLMAVDNRQRIKLLEKMCPEAEIGKMSQESKARLQDIVSEKLFGNPSIFISHIGNTSTLTQEQQQTPKQITAVTPAISPSALAAACYEEETNKTEGYGEEVGTSLAR